MKANRMSVNGQNQTKGKKHSNINIGMIIFLIILIYIVICVFIYLGKEKISVVEVQHGKIVDNGYYTGIILRSEQVVPSTNSGYVNYYVQNGGKVAKDGQVYLMNTGSPSNTNAQSSTDVTDFTSFAPDDYNEIKDIISVYASNYTDSHYSDLYTFKYDLQNQISEAISNYEISNAQAAISQGSGNYISVPAPMPGVVSYTYDNMEALTKEAITDDMFNSNNYEKHQITSNQWVNAGDVAYKLVTDNDWSIVIKLTPTQAADLADKNQVTVHFLKDDITATANIELFTNGESNYACLSLSKYMVRYLSERYIEIELIASSPEGLKIPTSAVTTKEFYKIPVEYLITDESTNESGFYKYVYDELGEAKALFYKATIYANDGEYCYVDMDDFTLGDNIGKPDSSDTYRIGATGGLTGVYNINQGYTIFRLVNILYQNDEYCIIEENTAYGISLYDRIILNADAASENQLIY